MQCIITERRSNIINIGETTKRALDLQSDGLRHDGSNQRRQASCTKPQMNVIRKGLPPMQEPPPSNQRGNHSHKPPPSLNKAHRPPHNIIRIHHECEAWIAKSIQRITKWHYEACQMMTNGDCNRRIILSHPYTNNRLFFFLTTKYRILY